MEYSNIHPIQDAINTIIPNSKDKKNISNTKLFQKKKHSPRRLPPHSLFKIHYSLFKKTICPPNAPPQGHFLTFTEKGVSQD